MSYKFYIIFVFFFMLFVCASYSDILEKSTLAPLSNAADTHIINKIFNLWQSDNLKDHEEGLALLSLQVENSIYKSRELMEKLVTKLDLLITASKKRDVLVCSTSPRRLEIANEICEGMPNINVSTLGIRDKVKFNFEAPETFNSKVTLENNLMALSFYKVYWSLIEAKYQQINITNGKYIGGDFIFQDSKDSRKPIGKLSNEQMKNNYANISGTPIKGIAGICVVDLSGKKPKVTIDYESSFLILKNKYEILKGNNRKRALKFKYQGADNYLQNFEEITAGNLYDYYVDIGYGNNKAGGIGVQDKEFVPLIEGIYGDPYVIIGMPFRSMAKALELTKSEIEAKHFAKAKKFTYFKNYRILKLEASKKSYDISLLKLIAAESLFNGNLRTSAICLLEILKIAPKKFTIINENKTLLKQISKNHGYRIRIIGQQKYFELFSQLEHILNKINGWNEQKDKPYKKNKAKDIYFDIPDAKQKGLDLFYETINNPTLEDLSIFKKDANIHDILNNLLNRNKKEQFTDLEEFQYRINLNNEDDKESIERFENQVLLNSQSIEIAVVLNNLGPELIPTLALVKKLLDNGKRVTLFCSSEPNMINDITLPDLYSINENLSKTNQNQFIKTLDDIFKHVNLRTKSITPDDRNALLSLEDFKCAIMIGEDISGDFTKRIPPYNYTNKKYLTSFLFIYAHKNLTSLKTTIRQNEMFIENLKDYTLQYFSSANETVYNPQSIVKVEDSPNKEYLKIRNDLKYLASKEKNISQASAFLKKLGENGRTHLFKTLTAYLNGGIKSLKFENGDNPFTNLNLGQINKKCEELIAAFIQTERENANIESKASKNIELVSNLSTSPLDVLGNLLGRKGLSEKNLVKTDDISELLEQGILNINPSNPIAAGMVLALARIWNSSMSLKSGIIISSYTMIYKINRNQMEEIEWVPDNKFKPEPGEYYRIYTTTVAINVFEKTSKKCSVKFGYGMADIKYKEDFKNFNDNSEITTLKSYIDDTNLKGIDENLLSLAGTRNGQKIKDFIESIILKATIDKINFRSPIATAFIEKIVGDPYAILGFPIDFIKKYFKEQEVNTINKNIFSNIFKYQPSGKFSVLSFTRMEDMIKFRTTLQDYWINIENTLINQNKSLTQIQRTLLEIKLLTLKIKLAQRERRLYDAVQYCDNMLHVIEKYENVEPIGSFSSLKKELINLFEEYQPGTKAFNKHVWNYDSLSLDLSVQTSLFRKLDWITSLAFNWQERQPASRFIDSEGKDIKNFAYDWSGSYLFYDPCAWGKLNAMQQSILNFKNYLNITLSPDNISPDQIMNIISNISSNQLTNDQRKKIGIIWGDCIDRTAAENFRSDVQEHIRVNPLTLIDHRGIHFDNKGKDGITFIDSLLSNHQSDSKKKISIFLNNAGDETVLAIWQAYMLLEMGFDVTLYTSAFPTLDHDVTSDDIYFLLPYITKILSDDFNKKGIKTNFSLKEYIEKNKLIISPFLADYSNSTDCRTRLIEEVNKHDITILLGELWYGYLVGLGELSMTPFNSNIDEAYSYTSNGNPINNGIYLKGGSKVFSIMVHKNARQKIEYKDSTSNQGFIPSQETAYQAYIYQLFQSESWDAMHQEFDITMDKEVELEALYQDKSFSSLSQNLKNASSFYFSLTEDRNNFDMHHELSKDKKTLTFKYKTPTRRIKIEIEDKGTKILSDGTVVKKAIMRVDFFVNYEPLHRENFEYEIVRRAEWPVTRVKYPSLYIRHVENHLNVNTPLITHNSSPYEAKIVDFQKKYKIAEITMTDKDKSNVIVDDADYLIIDIDKGSKYGSNIYNAFNSKDARVYAKIERIFPPKPGSNSLRKFVSLAPVYLTKKGTPRFVIKNINKDETKILVSSVFVSNRDNTVNDMLAEKGISIDLDHSSNKLSFDASWKDNKQEKKQLSKDELKKEGQQKIRETKFISAPIDPYTHCAARSILSDFGGVEVVYSDLLRVGSILDPNFRRDEYWYDYEYINGLPRMDYVSGMYNVFQFALPHDTSGGNEVFTCTEPDPITGKKIFDWEKVKNTAARAAKIAEKMGANAIDINTGSPALASQSGGAFLNDLIVLKDVSISPFEKIERKQIKSGLKDGIIKSNFKFPYTVLKKHNLNESVKNLLSDFVQYIETKTNEILDENEKKQIEYSIYMGICKNLQTSEDVLEYNIEGLKKLAIKKLKSKDYFVSELITSIKASVNIPICIKTRIVPDESTQYGKHENLTNEEKNATKDFLTSLVDAGVAWVVVHTRFQKENYDKNAAKNRRDSFLEIIQDIKNSKDSDCPPFIINGEINGREDTKELEKILSKADGIMIATASLGNPFVFEKARNSLNGKTYSFSMSDFFKVILSHLKRDQIVFGEKFNLEKILLDILQYSGNFSTPEFWQNLTDFQGISFFQIRALNNLLTDVNPAIIAFMNKIKYFSSSLSDNSLQSIIDDFKDFIIIDIIPQINEIIKNVKDENSASNFDKSSKSKLDNTVINYVKKLYGKYPDKVNAILKMKFTPCKNNPTRPCTASCPYKCRYISETKKELKSIKATLNEDDNLIDITQHDEKTLSQEPNKSYESPNIFKDNKPLEFIKGNEPFAFYMIHLKPIPGSAGYSINDNSIKLLSPDEIINLAKAEAWLYKQLGAEGILIENMGDAPYNKREKVGPHVTAMMAITSYLIKNEIPDLKIGLQILAGANCEALSIAHAMKFNFIRMESSLYGHVPDEGGFITPDIYDVTKYKASLHDCEVALVTDIKKKHSAHETVTGDLGIAQMVIAASQNNLDGVIITGESTGEETNLEFIKIAKEYSLEINSEMEDENFTPKIFIGSGVTKNQISDIVKSGADAFIVGTSVKEDNDWRKPASPEKTLELVNEVREVKGLTKQTLNIKNIIAEYENRLHTTQPSYKRSINEFKNRMAENNLSVETYHLPAMPGNPRNRFSANEIIEISFQEIKQLKEINKLEAILLRNTDNTPYKTVQKIGDDDPMEITIMTILAWKVVHELGLFCGIEIADNPFGSLASAFASSAHFISSRSFGFQQNAPSGVLDFSPAELLQYRSLLGASSVMIFSNITDSQISYSASGEYGFLDKIHKAQNLCGSDGWFLPEKLKDKIPKGTNYFLCHNKSSGSKGNSISNYQPKKINCSSLTTNVISQKIQKAIIFEKSA